MNQTSLFDHYSESDSDNKYNNQSLFSDHYLNEILRREKVWPEAQAAAAALLPQLRQLYEAQREPLLNDGYNEAQLEIHWLRPIFELLGHTSHTMESQPTIPGLGGGIKKPDYIFFPDEAARLTAVSAQNSRDYAQNGLAVGEVKAWGVNLDRKTGSSPTFADNNPMYQIDTYLRATGLEWGILSNGRFWRLVHKDSAYRLDTYFEIDLLAALNSPYEGYTQLVLSYFLLFFRQAALLPDPSGHDEAQQPFLNRALEASRAYARALEADLRDNAYRALEQLILGFFAANPDQLDPQQADDREKVYRNSLFLLYRLLFLLYGESRGLLPIDNPIYAERFSLKALTTSINQRRNRLEIELTRASLFWEQLRSLFHVIGGVNPYLNEELGVHRYNGGLFLPERHPFLETYPVGDRYLMQAIDYLAYRRVREDGRFEGYERVDYRTLSERQLGSIYEGLLEYRVSLAETEMVTVRKGGVETWLPASERGRATALDRRQPGELYMATDKGERKATGSYYTPDYIVKYIVEQTLGPLIETIRARIKAEIDGRSDLNQAQKQAHGAARFVEEILALNVLDPAMGSGHFLVEATHFLARALATNGPQTADDGRQTADDGPQTAADDGRQTADDEPQTADDGPQTADDGPSSIVHRPSSIIHRPSSIIHRPSSLSEADLNHWRRRVVEACIYGVDKNEMAVELAKLSLWLVTAAADKPLSFLDHHLRHGDSLVGAWLADLERPPLSSSQTAVAGQDPLFDESAFTGDAGLAVKGLMTIERLPSEDIDAVYAKERTYRQIREEHLARWRKLADLWVSAFFGNKMTREEYRDLALRLQGRTDESMLRESQAQPYLTHPAMGQPDYFHWELEFPEVFFDEYGRALGEAAGFDVVIGNPPYEELSEDERGSEILEISFFNGNIRFAPAMGNRINLYRIFVVQGLNLTRNHGWHGFIVPMSLLADQFTLSLRKYLLQSVWIKILELFPQKDDPNNRIFIDAKLSTCLYVIKKLMPNEHVTFVRTHPGRDILAESPQYETLQSRFFQFDGDNYSIPGIDSKAWNLVLKLAEMNKFGDYATASPGELMINRSIKPYLTEEGKGEEVIRGSHISLYQMVEPKQGESLYLNKKKYLADRTNSAKAHHHKSNRVVYQRYAAIDNYRRLIATLLPAGHFCSHTTGYFSDVKTVDQKFLLCLMNSQLLDWRFNLTSTNNNINGYEVEALPVPPISFSTPENERTAVVQTAQAHYEAGEETAVLAWCESELENGRNDTIHDLLAYLAQQMIDLNRAQQDRVAHFWLDLEGVLADPNSFAKLRHKGKWEKSLHKKVPAARPYVDSDSRSTISLDTSLGWTQEAFTGFVRELAGSVPKLSRLVGVYQDHAGEYGRLAQQISSTDQIIDQIVYRLYGLTDDEIAIVEGV